jgi:hypothetical protein
MVGSTMFYHVLLTIVVLAQDKPVDAANRRASGQRHRYLEFASQYVDHSTHAVSSTHRESVHVRSADQYR